MKTYLASNKKNSDTQIGKWANPNKGTFLLLYIFNCLNIADIWPYQLANNIASFEKSSSSYVKMWAKSNAKINSTSIFLQIVTILLMDFSKEAILFLIYLQADRGKYVDNAKLQFFFCSLAHSALCTMQKIYI